MKQQYKFLIIFGLLLLPIIVLELLGCFSGNTYSKYIGEREGSSTPIGTAIPIINDTTEIIDVPLDDMVPGDTKYYEFSVINFDNNNNVSDVTMNYIITVNSTPYLPLDYSLEKDNVQNNVLNNNVSQVFSLEHSVLTTHNYKLVITWPINENDYKYANGLESVSIVIEAEQKVD